MNDLLRFTAITLVMFVAILSLLVVGGVWTMEELRENLVKVVAVLAILLAGSAAVVLLAKK